MIPVGAALLNQNLPLLRRGSLPEREALDVMTLSPHCCVLRCGGRNIASVTIPVVVRLARRCV